MKSQIVYSKENPNLFCQVEFSNDITLTLYIHKKWWFIGYDVEISGSKIEIHLVDCDVNDRGFPRVMHYEYGGVVEMWQKDLFLLDERIKQMFDDYNGKVKRAKQLQKEIQNKYGAKLNNRYL